RSYWRLKPGVTLAQAQAEMPVIDGELAKLYPGEDKDRKTLLVPMKDWVVGQTRTPLLVLFAAVGFVLLVACANFANLLVALAASLLTGLVFGLIPAWTSLRTDPAEALKEAGRGASAGGSSHRLRSLLIVSEVALALLLLIGAGLLIKAFWLLRSVDPGFTP